MGITDKAQDWVNDQAEKYGVPRAFLGKENTNRGLNAAAQALLDTIDRTAQRQYLDSGFSNVQKTKPNIRSIITQTPEAVILIKKKFISTLADNFNPELLDKNELHFLRASKQLFKNKCATISNYEKLTKLTNVIQKHGTIVSPIANMIFETINTMESDDFNAAGDSAFTAVIDQKSKNYLKSHKDAIQKIRAALTLNGFEDTTTWVTNNKASKDPTEGEGTGVIELTLVTDFTTNTSTTLGDGSCSLNIADPYGMFWVDADDIEKAIFQSSYKKFSIYNVTADMLQQETDELKQEFNNTRMARGASGVSYKINISSTFYNKVIIMIDRIGVQITNDDGTEFYKESLENFNNSKFNGFATFEQFTQNEFDLLTHIYKNLFKIMGLKMQDYADYRGYNEETNNVRKQMLLYYSGKRIIQVMDTVSIFIDSQKVEDKQVLAGIGQTFTDYTDGIMGTGSSIMKGVSSMFNSTNFAGLLNQTAMQLKRFTDPSKIDQKENAFKNLLVGKEFPMWLWNSLRSNFISSDFGTCIFCGIISSVKSSYQDGSSKISISAKDNSSYFEQGWISTKPSTLQFNGALYDPLTPFNFEFNATDGLPPGPADFTLLEENRRLLNSKQIRIQDGKNAGEIATAKTYSDVNIEPKTALSQLSNNYTEFANKIYTDPDGFVYRWKRGIATAIVNQSGTKDGLMSGKLVQEDIAQVVSDDPFGGQDLVNIVSILVCGEPYDFSSFLRAANNFGAITMNPNFNPANDYFQGLFKRIKRQNKIWGDFIPFARSLVDPQTFGVQMALQSMYFAHSSSIKQKQNEKALLINKLMQLEGGSKSFDPSSFIAPINNQQPTQIISTKIEITSPIIKRILELDAEIQLHQQIITESISQSDLTKSSISVVGDNLYFTDGDQTKADKTRAYKLKIAEQNEVMKRRLWQVKSNTDNNLFVVGNEYSTDYDIQSLTQNIASNYSFIDTNWSKVKDKLNTAISPTGMELFVNSQGHLELRTPKYNRMPSSVLFDMIKRKEEYKIQVYPDFLEKLFKNKAGAVFEEIEILEDKIRIAVIALGCKDDDNIISGYLQSNVNDLFIFLTNPLTGTLTGLQAAVTQISKDYAPADDSGWSPVVITNEVADFFERNTGNDAVLNLQKAANTKNTFDINSQLANYQFTLDQAKNSNSGGGVSLYNSYDGNTQKIRQRLSQKLGIPYESVQRVDEYLPNSKNGKLNPIDINNIQSKIQQYITQRYEAICFAVNIIKNLDNAARINAPKSDVYGKLLMPNLLGDETIPDFLYDMIEDESYDDYGIGSGKRFVIRNKDIISFDTEENDPEFTSINLSGSEMGGLVGGEGFAAGDIKLANVWATDYDLWRMYGFKETTAQHKPYLSDPELQIAPYAIFSLNQERAKILTAFAVVAGDEAKQPGEVYFLEHLGLLFYSKKVTHTFNYGSSYHTSLELIYGHVPGEYIPTPLDIIGKNVYNTQHLNIGNYRIARSGTIGNNIGTVIGSVMFPSLSPKLTDDTEYNLLGYDSIWGPKNSQTIADIKGKIIYLASKTLPQQNSKFEGITVRIYTNKNYKLYNAALYIVKQLMQIVPSAKIVGGDMSDGQDKYLPGEVMICSLGSNSNNKSLNNKIRNPSTKAWEIARNLAKTYSSQYDTLKEEQKSFIELQYITNNIIDICIEESIVPTDELIQAASTTTSSSSQTTGQQTTVKSTTLQSMYNNYDKLKSSKTTADDLAKVKINIITENQAAANATAAAETTKANNV